MKNYQNPLNDETINSLTSGLEDLLGQTKDLISSNITDEMIDKMSDEQKEIFNESQGFVAEFDINNNNSVQDRMSKIMAMVAKQDVNIKK